MGMFDLGIGGLYRGAKSFMNPGKAYEKGQEQLDQYYNHAQEMMRPYHNQGQEAYGHLNTAMQNLLDPSALYDQFTNNYQQSDASKFAQERAKQNGLNSLSAMGMIGSTPGLQALQAGQSEIGAIDQQRYMDQMIQQYIQGAGLAQGIYGQGANAAGQMSNNAMNMGGQSADLAYGREAAPGNMFGSLLGTTAGLGGSYMGMQGMNNMARSNNNMANAWRTGR